MTAKEKLTSAISDLDHALTFQKQALKDHFYYGGIAKAYETAIEYAWKYFRAEAIEAGLEAESPRDAIKQAGVLSIINDVENWLRFLKLRNVAVHDYLGLRPEDYLKAANELAAELKKLKLR